jgi:gliding motility-associated-like protein
MIYNRWGEELFRTNDINEGWDGTFRGQLCQDDAYVWIVQYTGVSGVQLEESGTVTLLR